MLGQEEARRLCQDIFSRCGGNPAEVMLTFEDNALTRFANNTIHQNVSERNVRLTLRVFIGQSSGTATTNRLDEVALSEIAERARLSAQVSPPDPNYPGLPEPAEYRPVRSFDEETAALTPQERALAVGGVCQLAGERGFNASGAFSTAISELVIANTQGLFAYHPATSADFQTVVMGADSSGRAHLSGWRVGEIPVETLGRRAVETAERSRNPREVKPGIYPVVFDPDVTEDLLNSLNFYGMGAQAVLEGRSWMIERIGQQAMHPLVSIWDDGLDSDGTPQPFDFEGVPKQRVDIVKEGVVMGPVYDRLTAAKAGKATTGHAMPPTFRGFGPLATNLFMAPGSATVDEMIRATRRGLYVSRFWYTRLVHPRDCVVTGMTRDGVFMVENGEIAYPVKNLRFTQSYVDAFANVEGVGRDTCLFGDEFGGISVRVPALKISGFNFTGTTV